MCLLFVHRIRYLSIRVKQNTNVVGDSNQDDQVIDLLYLFSECTQRPFDHVSQCVRFH